METKHLRKDAAENRRRILEAASEVFAAEGLDASVDDIARVANVGMGTLYRRFPTKDALIDELVNDLLDEMHAEALHALNQRDGHGLERFFYSSAKRQVASRGCLTRMWGKGDSERIEQIRTLIADLLADAQLNNQIRADVTTSDIFLVLWSLKGVIDLTQSVVAHAWQRHLAIAIAGLRPSAVPLAHSALTPREIKAIRSVQYK